MEVETLDAADLFDAQTGCHYHYITQIKSITQIHRHNFCEIFLVAQGTVVHRIGGLEERLAQGTLMLIRPWDTHGYLPDGDTACCIANLAFPLHWLRAALAYLMEDQPQALLTISAPPRTVLPDAKVNGALRAFHELSAKTVKTIILQRLTDLLFENEAIRPGEPPWLTAMVRRMQSPAHFTKGVAEMEALCDKSPEHMYRVFKRCYGQTPSQYLNDLKAAYAAHLLKHTDLAIVDAAMDAGFENLSYFYTQFKRRYQTSPRQYRIKARHAKSIP